jgi:hypothetical protein
VNNAKRGINDEVRINVEAKLSIFHEIVSLVPIVFLLALF